MACNSVAVTSAQITQVLLDKAGLIDAFAKLLGVDPAKITADSYTTTYNGAVLWVRYMDYETGTDIYWIQSKGQLELTVTSDRALSGESRAKFDAYADDLKTRAAGAALVAQQRSLLTRLAKLGKLSNVQQKESGVVAKLEITI